MHNLKHLRIIFFSFLSFILLTGCDIPGNSSQKDITILGVVNTGNITPLENKTVNLYSTAGDESFLLASTTTNKDGNFAFSVSASSLGGVMFVSAHISEGVELLSIIGTEPKSTVVVNELTTVAASYAFAQFFSTTLHRIHGRGDPLSLSIAAQMSANLVDVTTGKPSSVMLNTPNADQTNSLRSLRNLANMIASCISDPANLPKLLLATPSASGRHPITSTEALVFLAQNPHANVYGVYALSRNMELYTPTLEKIPDAWTLAVKVNNSGSNSYTFGGPANTVFDERGYAWINNNIFQGTTGSSNFVIVLKPDGTPSDGTDGTPTSPIVGGGILGAGFGITYNKYDKSIWMGNFGWGGVNPGPSSGGGNGAGSVSNIALDGRALSPSTAYDGGTNRVQGILTDNDGNIWTASYGNNKLIVLLGGDSSNTLEFPIECQPFGLAHNPDDNSVWATTVGCFNEIKDSGVGHYKIENNKIRELSFTKVGNSNKGLDVDFDGSVWIASGSDNTVYHVSSSGKVLDSISGVGGLISPWGIRIDDQGNVWVANFGSMQLELDNIYYNSSITSLAGVRSTSGKAVGTALSPTTGFTLPTAGAEVLMFDGTPLSQTGNNQPKYTPMMRTVSAVSDRAGNLWVSNNWKPNLTTNLYENPGGDGMVIFVGLSAPTIPGRTQ
ncbi:MAG: hypothetical protein GQ570_14955 [Helicobacteraceae bacterium]|nr:hypothetical protein [Helicobacteraceae bacterium]